MSKTYVEKFIKEVQKTELDMDFPFWGFNPLSECDDNDRNEVMIPNNRLTFAEAPSMDIDECIDILEGLKSEGANRVYIADHIDHRGYHIYGVELKEI
jgi:hypothetical protein